MSHATLAATALRLIAKHGRNVTVRKLATEAQVVDSDQPWRGNDQATVSDPIETGEPISETVKAVLLDFDETDDVSDDLKRGGKKALVAALASTQDLRQFSRLIDGSETWKIVICKTTEPGAVRMLYEFHLKR